MTLQGKLYPYDAYIFGVLIIWGGGGGDFNMINELPIAFDVMTR